MNKLWSSLDILFLLLLYSGSLKICNLSVLFSCPPSGMRWAWLYIDDLIWSLDIKCLEESVDGCYEHCVPVINICWMNIYNRSAFQSWRLIWGCQWFMNFTLTSSWNYLWLVLFSLNCLLPWCSSPSNLFYTLMGDKSSWNTTLMLLLACSMSFNNFLLMAAQSHNSLL